MVFGVAVVVVVVVVVAAVVAAAVGLGGPRRGVVRRDYLCCVGVGVVAVADAAVVVGVVVDAVVAFLFLYMPPIDLTTLHT